MEDLEVILDDIESQEAEVTDLNYIPDYQVYEQERRENEAERIANENERKANEVIRVGNEETRTENESTRVGNESDRVTAEGLRVSAEEGRVEAEADRVLAEEHREEVINSLSDVATSGSYNDLSDKPDIPENTSDLTNDSGYITKDVNNLTYYTIKTNTGSLIDLEINSSTYVVTLKLKDIDGTVISSDTIDLPLENVVVSGRYDNATKKVILTLQNGSEVSFSVADLVSGLQSEITNDNKLASDLVDDSNSGHKFVTTTEKSTWSAKQDLIDNSHKLSSDLVDDSGTNKFVSASDITNWNGKYTKPSGGIPKTDLASAVQTTLDAVSGKEDTSNKVSTIDENSTDTQYPSAKCVYDSQVAQDTQITQLQAENDYLNSVIEQAFDETTQTGETISIDNTIQAKMKVDLNGNTSQVSYTGKNINSSPIAQGLWQGSDGRWVNNFANYVATKELVSVEYGNTITVSNQNNVAGGWYVLEYDENKAYLNQNGHSGSQTSFTYTIVNQNTKYIAIDFAKQGTTPSEIGDIQIELGSTATDYEPYCGGIPSPNPSYPQPIQVVSGDNEINIYGISSIYDGEFEQYGWDQTIGYQLTKVSTQPAQGRCKNIIEVSPNTTYKFTLNGEQPEGNVRYIFANSSKTIISTEVIANGVFTTPSNCYYMVFHSTALRTKYGDTLPNPIITKITTYPISLGNLELCKIGTYQDKFFKAINGNTIYDNLDSTIKNTLDYGDWYLEKNIGKVVLDGSEENWGSFQIEPSGLGRAIVGGNNIFYDGNKRTILCNKLKGVQYSASWNNTFDCIASYASNRFIAYLIGATDLTTFKNKLASGFDVYYVLATPTYTKIEGTLASQLDNIYNAMSKKGQTNITQVNNDLALIINASALVKTP